MCKQQEEFPLFIYCTPEQQRASEKCQADLEKTAYEIKKNPELFKKAKMLELEENIKLDAEFYREEKILNYSKETRKERKI